MQTLYRQKGRKGLKYNRKRGDSSQKGDNNSQTKINAASDSNQVQIKLTKTGRVSKNNIIYAFGDKFSKTNKLVTDVHASYTAFAKEVGLEHISFFGKKA